MHRNLMIALVTPGEVPYSHSAKEVLLAASGEKDD
jgi:hypothetical protein